MANQKRSIVIIGGGITGLSAAHYARKALRERLVDADVTVLESEKRPGGKIQTLRKDGFVIERGPDSVLTRKSATLELADDLGILGELTGLNPNAKATYVLSRGKLHRLPPGLVLGIPSQISPFLKTKVLSVRGKLRAGLDFVLPPKKDREDESLARFLGRRLGREVVERIAEPLLAGIYAGSLDNLSIKATFPQFMEMEEKHGSLIRAMMLSRSKPAPAAPKPVGVAAKLPPDAKGSMFVTFRNGLHGLVDKLEESLGDRLRTGNAVTEVRREGDRYLVTLSDGSALAADAVIVAAPAYAAAAMLPDAQLAEDLAKIPYVTVGNVILAYRREDVQMAQRGSGFVIPRTEGRAITACTWTSEKWLHTAPKDSLLLRCYIGRAGDEKLVGLPDGELLEIVRREVRDLMGIDAAPLFHVVNRWPHAMPQYAVGHLERLERINARLRETMPGVCVAGAGYAGVGIPDCIVQGRAAAVEAVGLLAEQAPDAVEAGR